MTIPAAELVYRIGYTLTTISSIGHGIFVLYKNPRSRINVVWALFSTAVAVWAWFVLAAMFDPVDDRALLAARISQYAASFIPVFFTHFCLALLGQPARRNGALWIGYGCIAVLSVTFLTPWFVPSAGPIAVFRHFPQPGPLYVAFTIHFFWLVLYGYWRLFRHLHHQSPDRQNQIRWVATATVIGYACGSTMFLPAYGIAVNPLPSLFTRCTSP